MYFDSDIVILDDPLSALDAHVGKAVFQNVISGALKNKTRVLVTHALHFLPLVDHILVMENGTIAEQGTYSELIKAGGSFSQLIKQFGSQEDTEKEKETEVDGMDPEEEATKRRKAVQGSKQMQAEERVRGSIGSKGEQQRFLLRPLTVFSMLAVYREYFTSAHGKILLPLWFASTILTQGAQVMSGYW